MSNINLCKKNGQNRPILRLFGPFSECQQKIAENRRKLNKSEKNEKTLNASRKAPRGLRANPDKVLNSWDEADLEYVVTYLTSVSSQLGLGDCDYFSLDLGEIIPKFTINFNSTKIINVIDALYCVWKSDNNIVMVTVT